MNVGGCGCGNAIKMDERIGEKKKGWCGCVLVCVKCTGGGDETRGGLGISECVWVGHEHATRCEKEGVWEAGRGKLHEGR